MTALSTSIFAVAVLFLILTENGNAYICVSVGSNNLKCQLEAIEDTFVYDSTNQNFYDFLIVGQHPNYPLKRTLIRFEDIPSTCQKIDYATMNLFYWYAHKASFMTEQQVPFHPRPIQVRQVLKFWKETEVTRDQRFNGAFWSTPYLGLGNTDAKSSVDNVRVVSQDTVTGQYLGWDITKTARNWLAGEGNYGVILSAENEAILGREIRFYSREHLPNTKPYMEVFCLNKATNGGGGTGFNGGGGTDGFIGIQRG